MAKRLTGLNPLAYMGVEPLQPTDVLVTTSSPTTNDFQGFTIGDTWINKTTQQIYVFLGQNNLRQAQWIETGTASGVGASQFITDSGTADSTGLGVLNVVGGSNINTDGTVPNTVTINLDNSPSVSGSLTAGTTITAGTGITATTGIIRASAGDITIAAGNLNLPDTNTAGTRGFITQSAATLVHTYTLSGGQNIFVGTSAGNSTLSGSENAIFGAIAGAALVTGSQNTFVGYGSGNIATTAVNNTFIGNVSGTSITSGSDNIIIGFASGQNYVADESSNIILSNDGVASEDNVIRIGTAGSGSGEQNKCWIAGISGVTTDVNDAVAVLVDSTGQLGVTSSSRVYKDNIVSMHDDSVGLLSLRAVSFNYKSDPRQLKNYGFIAEEVAEVMPELVVFNQEGNPETVKYHVFPALIVNELQRLNERINELQMKCTCMGND